MDINGKVHCFFEQSGTFKNEFLKLGIPAIDYDIQNNFGQTDCVMDLFSEIELAYRGGVSVFNTISCDDVIFAFFPCINFCDAKTLMFKGVSIFQNGWSLGKLMDENIKLAQEREKFFELLMKLVSICAHRHLRLIVENPWNVSGETYLQRNFIAPTIIDKNRTIRGDYFVKPTAYWFINCKNTFGFTEQRDKRVRVVYKEKDAHKIKPGCCSEARSMISSDYARNFICDFIIGKEINGTQYSLFE